MSSHLSRRSFPKREGAKVPIVPRLRVRRAAVPASRLRNALGRGTTINCEPSLLINALSTYPSLLCTPSTHCPLSTVRARFPTKRQISQKENRGSRDLGSTAYRSSRARPTLRSQPHRSMQGSEKFVHALCDIAPFAYRQTHSFIKRVSPQYLPIHSF